MSAIKLFLHSLLHAVAHDVNMKTHHGAIYRKIQSPESNNTLIEIRVKVINVINHLKAAGQTSNPILKTGR